MLRLSLIRSLIYYILGKCIEMYNHYRWIDILLYSLSLIIIDIGYTTIPSILIGIITTLILTKYNNNKKKNINNNNENFNNNNENLIDKLEQSKADIERIRLSNDSVVSSLRIELERTRSEFKSLTTTYQNTKNDLQNALTREEEANDIINNDKKIYIKLQAEYKGVVKNYDTIVLDCANTRARLQTCEHNLSVTKADLAASKLQQEQLQLKLDTKDMELLTLRNISLSSLTDSAKGTISSSSSSSSNDNENLRANLAAMAINYEFANAELKQTQIELNTARQSYNEILKSQQQDNEIVARSHVMMNKYDVLQQSYDKLSDDLINTQKNLTAYIEENNILKQEIGNMKDSVTIAAKQNSELQLQLKDAMDLYNQIKIKKDKEKKAHFSAGELQLKLEQSEAERMSIQAKYNNLILKDILSPFAFNKPIGMSPKGKLNINKSDIGTLVKDLDVSMESIKSDVSSEYSSIITDTPVSSKAYSPKLLSPISPMVSPLKLRLDIENFENRNMNLEEL